MKRIAIIGGGLSGLTSAFYILEKAKKLNVQIEITILEKNNRIGGKINSIQQDGYLCEYGPNGFLDSKPLTLELCKKLGLEHDLLKSNDNARKRFIVDNNQLFKLPHNQSEFLTNKLVSWRGKLRILTEYFIKPSQQKDESVASFVHRRLGQEALDKLITPMSSGIYAGNPEAMSLAACFPRMKQLEDKFGGLFKAMFALKKERKNSNSKTSFAPSGVLTSFKNGIAVLTNKLAENIGYEKIHLGVEVSGIQKIQSQWNIKYAKDGSANTLLVDELIIATPAYVAADLVNEFDDKLSALLNKIKYSPLSVVCLGFDLSKLNCDVNGFGYLFTQNNDNKFVLGTLWDSSIFINRAPDGKILFRSMLGGAINLDILNLTNEELINNTQNSLKQVLGITEQPEFSQVFNHKYAIPQYNVGHLDLVSQIEQHVIQNHMGLHLTGNAYRGIGINDCIENSHKLAEAMSI